jgi:site-specific DNA recombinase
MISKDLLGCATALNKGTCDNRMKIRRDAREASVLNGLRTHLMERELFKEFCGVYRGIDGSFLISGGAVRSISSDVSLSDRSDSC